MRWKTGDLLLATTLIGCHAGSFGAALRYVDGLKLFGGLGDYATVVIIAVAFARLRRRDRLCGKRLLCVPLRLRVFWHLLFALGVGGVFFAVGLLGVPPQGKGGVAPILALLVACHRTIERYNRVDFTEQDVRIGPDRFAWKTTHLFLDRDRLKAAPLFGQLRVRRARWPRMPRHYLEEVQKLLEAMQADKHLPADKESTA